MQEYFLGLLNNDNPIKHALNNSESIIKNHIYNRATINALFSILKDVSGPFYEGHIHELVFSTYRYYQSSIDKISDEKLIINLNRCIDNYDVITEYFGQITKCAEFYRIAKEELDNFYNGENKHYQSQNPQFMTFYDTATGHYGYQQNSFPIYSSQQQMYNVVENGFDRIPMFGNDGKPMNKPAETIYNKRATINKTEDDYDKIPKFGRDGKPLNKSAEAIIKAIDRRILNYEKTKAHKAE